MRTDSARRRLVSLFFVFGAKFAEIGASTRTNHATWRVGEKIKGKECCILRVLRIMIVSGSLCLFHGMWRYSQNFSFPYKSYQFVVSFQATGPNRPLLLSNVVLCSHNNNHVTELQNFKSDRHKCTHSTTVLTRASNCSCAHARRQWQMTNIYLKLGNRISKRYYLFTSCPRSK